jgi:hypothetical protein
MNPLILNFSTLILKKTSGPILIFLVLIILNTNLHGQFLQQAFLQPLETFEEEKIKFSLSSSSFFHNNEFFHPLVKGYTLTGTWVQPRINYAFNEKFTASGGVHLLKYHGIENFSSYMPVFSFQYELSPNILFVLGNYPGGENHQLSEVLYQPERHFRDYPEGGLSIKMKNHFAESEIWVNWEKMIFHNDPFNEQVTAGSSSKFNLSGSDSTFHITIPLQIVAKHIGGQINTGNRSVDTWWNLLTGIESSIKFQNKTLRELSFKLHAPVYYYEGNTGYGIFPQLGADIGGSHLSLGYFRAANFQTIHGIALYDSYRIIPGIGHSRENGITENISLKSGFTIHIHENVKLISRFDAWYDTRRSKIDYLSGLYILINL